MLIAALAVMGWQLVTIYMKGMRHVLHGLLPQARDIPAKRRFWAPFLRAGRGRRDYGAPAPRAPRL
ncbi:MAG: hypothetical protein R2881_05095 [Eubacteriales bacterium]